MRIAIIEHEIEHYPTVTLNYSNTLDKLEIIWYNSIIKQIRNKEIKK